MRIIYETKTGKIRGVIADRVTSHIPPSSIGKGTDSVDIDYGDEAIVRDPLVKLIDREKSGLLRKRIILPEGNSNNRIKDIQFEDLPEPEVKRWTVIVDTLHPKFHKDVGIYYKKALEKGAKSEIDHSGELINVTVRGGGDVVGTATFRQEKPCCFVYYKGKVFNRDYYPHYVALYDVIKYLAGILADRLDLGGMVTNDEGLNEFKRKWGKEVNRPRPR